VPVSGGSVPAGASVSCAVGNKQTRSLKVVRDVAMAGDDEPLAVAERPQLGSPWRSPTPIGRRAAVDVLWLLMAGDGFHRLVHRRRWSVARYQAWLADSRAATAPAARLTEGPAAR
jgi:hypothetical protein